MNKLLLATGTFIAIALASGVHAATCTPIENFSGGTSVADNSGPLSNALHALTGSGGCVAFSAGKYRFNSAVAFTLPSPLFHVELVGAGRDATILSWGSTDGLSLTTASSGSAGDSFRLADLSITTTAVGGHAGFTANGPQSGGPGPSSTSTLDDVSFRGDDCYACTDLWSYGAVMNGWSNVNFKDPVFNGAAPSSGGYSTNGIGLLLTSSSTTPGVQYNITGAGFAYNSEGIRYTGYSQGLTVNQSNFVGNSYGISVPGGSNVSQLNVTNSQFNSSKAGIADGSGILYDQIVNNSFLEPQGAVGLYLENYNGFSIVGNVFTAVQPYTTNPTGVIVHTSKGFPGVITGNLFNTLSQGVWLASGSTSTNVQANRYVSVNTPVNDQGSADSVGVATP